MICRPDLDLLRFSKQDDSMDIDTNKSYNIDTSGIEVHREGVEDPVCCDDDILTDVPPVLWYMGM